MTVQSAFALFQRGDLAGAERELRGLISREPSNADAMQLLAGVMHAKGDMDGALRQFARAAELEPQNPGIAFNRASLLFEAKRFEESERAFAKFLALAPGDAQALYARGLSLCELDRNAEAIECFDAAERAGMRTAPLLVSRGVALGMIKAHAKALADFDAALAVDANDAKAHFNRGKALADLDQPREAIAAFDRALAIDQNYAAAWNNRGSSLMEIDDVDGAFKSFERALLIEPNKAEFALNPGLAMVAINKPREALVHCKRSLELDPEYGDALFMEALQYLIEGDYPRGLPLYEGRWRGKDITPRPHFDFAPLWLGEEDIDGKTVMVSGEQGFGDCFQFCRYLPLLAERGARVILGERPVTLGLMGALDGVAAARVMQHIGADFDLHIPIASLPLAFRTTVETIPNKPYLKAEPERIERWRARLPATDKKRVGVVWFGGKQNPILARRALDVQALEQILRGADAQFVSLQFEAGEAAPLLEKYNVLHFGRDTADFRDLVALISCCDAVIANDTGVAHLAGGLGLETHILLPFAPDWRWMLDRSDSPWYPSATLHRQLKARDWSAPIDSAKAALKI